MSAEEDRRAGFVLVSVLGLVMLFASVSAALAVRARLLALQEANRQASLAAELLADGAAMLAADALRRPGAPPLPINGALVACPLRGGASLRLRAVDQGGLLDLNAAPPPMIVAVFTAAGLDDGTARRLAAEIVDFRDADDTASENGAEAADYHTAGLPHRPRNDFFADPAEFAGLPSATPEIRARLGPLLTVFHPVPSIDPAATDIRAPALKRPAPKKADAAPAMVERASAANPESLSAWIAPSDHAAFALSVEVRIEGRASFVRDAVIAGAPDAAPILRWSRGRPERVDDKAPAPAASPFCATLAAALSPDL